jgi:predicted ATPase
MIARATSSRVLWILGYPDRAKARAQETLQLARSQRQPMTLGFALVVTQDAHLHRGEWEAALTIGEEVDVLCRDYGMPQEREFSRSIQGVALGATGRLDEGIALLTDSLAAQRASGSELVRSVFLMMLGDLLRFAGRVDDGLRAVDEAFAYAAQSGEVGWLAELHRARAELLRVRRDEVGAEDSFTKAIAYARGQQARSFELRAATGLAQLLIASNRHAEARTVLDPVYHWFTEGLDTADLVAARNTLEDIRSPTSDRSFT